MDNNEDDRRLTLQFNYWISSKQYLYTYGLHAWMFVYVNCIIHTIHGPSYFRINNIYNNAFAGSKHSTYVNNILSYTNKLVYLERTYTWHWNNMFSNYSYHDALFGRMRFMMNRRYVCLIHIFISLYLRVPDAVCYNQLVHYCAGPYTNRFVHCMCIHYRYVLWCSLIR